MIIEFKKEHKKNKIKKGAVKNMHDLLAQKYIDAGYAVFFEEAKKEAKKAKKKVKK